MLGPTRSGGRGRPTPAPPVAAVATVALLVAVSLASCAGGGAASAPNPSTTVGARPTTTGSATSSITQTAPPTAPPTTPPADADRGTLGSGRPVSLVFGGDVHFEGELRPRLLADPESVLDPVAPLLSAADVAVVNLETAVTERGTPADKDYTFRAPPTAFLALRAAGVDVASMANNHGMDFGPEGLDDSLAGAAFTLFPVIGIGRDDTEAYAPYRVTVRGQRLAVIGATQVLDDHLIGSWSAGAGKPGLASAKDVERLVAEVERARLDSDTVVVYLHWGTERQTCPNAQQQELARQLADAGADIVVGGHAHRVLAGGMLGDTLVHFGLGNFVFYGTAGKPTAESGLLRVTITGRRVDAYEWIPATISAGVARPLEGLPALAAAVDWDERRACTELVP